MVDKNSITNATVFSFNYPPSPDAFAEGVIIPIDKPLGWTSADVVRKIKFALQRKTNQKKLKVGHAGTLDPLATGVLLVCTGKATKQAATLQAEEKEYIAEIAVGATTPSFDLERTIDARYPFAHITKAMVEAALKTFTGTQEQIPPVFSAKMLGGKRAYKFAHAGQDAVMQPSVITIYEMELISFDLPKFTVRIVCSKGTYIRALARDLGVALQSGAHLTNLRRTRSGKFNIQTVISLNDFEKFLLDI
ncbi:MAG: tRNA pseudouridine(55) synthase TruB [Prevotellaceae bacterium]|jgi:tRNA pseudouridine55 synthase|nr:tRNA pseudouridine(55) synthase TruB [Prevotellaceae bacterium]